MTKETDRAVRRRYNRAISDIRKIIEEANYSWHKKLILWVRRKVER
jgi:hypothetical protein